MVYLHSRKVFLTKLPGTEELVIIPMDPIFQKVFIEKEFRQVQLEVLKIGTKIGDKPISSVCVYKQYTGVDTLGNESHQALDFLEDDYQKIVSNNGVCYIQTDKQGIISAPSNISDCKILIHFDSPESKRLESVKTQEGVWFNFEQFPSVEEADKRFAVMDTYGNVDDLISFEGIVRGGSYIKDYWLPKGYVWQVC